MEDATAERRLEKLEKERKVGRRTQNLLVLVLGLLFFLNLWRADQLSEKAQHLEDRIRDTSHYTGVSGLSVDWGRWKEETTSGGLKFGAVSDKEECLEIYSYSIYGFDPPSYSRSGVEDAKSRVLLLDFLPSPELLGKVIFSTRWYMYEDQECFVLEPGHTDLPGGMVWFDRGEKVYVGYEPDDVAHWAAWAAANPELEEEIDRDRPRDDAHRRIFEMPKEGAWTFSIEDGLVRVED